VIHGLRTTISAVAVAILPAYVPAAAVFGSYTGTIAHSVL